MQSRLLQSYWRSYWNSKRVPRRILIVLAVLLRAGGDVLGVVWRICRHIRKKKTLETLASHSSPFNPPRKQTKWHFLALNLLAILLFPTLRNIFSPVVMHGKHQVIKVKMILKQMHSTRFSLRCNKSVIYDAWCEKCRANSDPSSLSRPRRFSWQGVSRVFVFVSCGCNNR